MASRRTKLFRRILHPSDFSPASGRAFAKAVELAKGSGAELLIVHVLPVLPLLPDVYVAATTYDELLRGRRAGATKQLDRLVSNARASSGARAIGVVLDFGVPAERIARFAKARHVE